jgi:hypothetical protein
MSTPCTRRTIEIAIAIPDARAEQTVFAAVESRFNSEDGMPAIARALVGRQLFE